MFSNLFMSTGAHHAVEYKIDQVPEETFTPLYRDMPEPPAVYRPAPAGSVKARKIAQRRAKGRTARKQNQARRKRS